MKIFKEVREMNTQVKFKSITLKGYVNVVGTESKVLNHSKHGDFIEIITPGTFGEALRRARDVDLLLNHNWERKLGSLNGGNIELYEDNIGLRIKAHIFDNEVINRAKNKQLSGWSFKFIPLEEIWVQGKDYKKRRYILKIDLREVSVLDIQQIPAYLGNSVECAEYQNEVINISDLYQKHDDYLKLKGGI